MMKRVFSILMCLLLCFSFSATANAQTVQTSIVQPYYEKASNAMSELSVSDTKATCISTTKGKSDVTKIVAEQTLQKQGFLWIWSTYDGAEWVKTTYTNILAMSNTKTGLSSGKYRLKTVFTLTDKNGKTETITVYSDEKSV
ncbi:MAG: hypothetical protein NC299_04695 [Lachnospiraceae bacterium]|nr:hypothetical protein [Ruminococcus sp.]MCM1274648.1 hypothetical protein [Lachnospiraceae bacterium]